MATCKRWRALNFVGVPALDNVAPILTELGIDTTQWITGVQQFNQRFYSVAGGIEALRSWCERLQQSWLKSFSFSRQIFQ